MTIAEFRFPRIFLLAFACAVLVGLAQPCSAQNGLHGPLPPLVSAPPPSPPAPPQAGLGGIADRVKGYERNAPDREDRVHIGLGTEHFNAIFGGLGQGSGVAFGIQATTADDLPGVELSAAAIVSTKLYRAFEVEAYVPSVGSENTHADFRFRYLRRTKDNFFGLGPNTGDLVLGTAPGFPNVPAIAPAFSSEAYETNYDLEQRRTAGALFHDFTENFQAGVYVQYVSSSTYEGDDDKDPPLGTFFFPAGIPRIFRIPPGQVTDARIPVPGLFTGSKILTEGVYAEYDARSNDDGLTKGFYAYGRLANHDGIGDIDSPSFLAPFPPTFFEQFASDLNDYGWVGVTFDVRGYIPLGTDRASLALRYFSELNNTKGGSLIPFYDLARLGGRTTLRGFDTFRFHGENSILFQGEVRLTAWQQEQDKGVDVIVFGDTGQVWGLGLGDNRRGASFLFDDLDRDNFEADFGGGVQYRYNKEFTLRLDVGHSNETTKVWFSFNRVF